MQKIQDIKPVCLYDGFKIRNYEPSYFDFIVANAEKFNLILAYRINTMELSLPLTATCLGFSSIDGNKKMGFKISLKVVCKDKQMKRCVEISGSFHKFHNKWRHNADDFFIESFIKSVEGIVDFFKLPLETTEVCNLEIGLNIELPEDYKAKDVSSSVLFLKAKSIAETETRINRNKKGYSFYRENTTGKKKIYSKSDQYREYVNDKEVLRIEIKWIKRREITRAIGIKNLKDLFEISYHDAAADYFYNNIRRILIYQKEIEASCPNNKMYQIFSYRDPNFWEKLWKKDKKEYYLNKGNYTELVDSCCSWNITEYIGCIIYKKSVDFKRTIHL